MGEYADAHVIEGEKRTTHRVYPVADHFRKYDSIISKDLNRKSEKSFTSKVSEFIFGTAEEAHHSKRLGAMQVIVTNPKQDLFSASVFMGGNQRMEMLIDTATDFVAVNGVDCAKCKESSIYDIESNYINDIATIAFNKNVTEYYGTSRFDGVYATDQLCFTLSKCFTLDFLYVSS